MIKRIIALSLTICMTAAISGCSANTREGVEYECGDFKFQVSEKYIGTATGTENSTYFFRQNSDDTNIQISSSDSHYADIKVWLDYVVKNTENIDTGDVKLTSAVTTTDLDCDYAAGAVHFEYSNGTGDSTYYIENETKGLAINANYKLSDKDSICRELEKIVRSAEYISNYRAHTDSYKVENDYFSVLVPKEWYYYTMDFEGTSKCSYIFRRVRARSVDEINTNVIIRTPETDYGSLEEAAEKCVETFKEVRLKPSRFKSEIFGIEAECVEAKVDDSDIIVREYYFEHGGLLWTININYSTDDELAAIEEMLSRIELK